MKTKTVFMFVEQFFFFSIYFFIFMPRKIELTKDVSEN